MSDHSNGSCPQFIAFARLPDNVSELIAKLQTDYAGSQSSLTVLSALHAANLALAARVEVLEAASKPSLVDFCDIPDEPLPFKCPQCLHNLEKADNNGVSHCPYCYWHGKIEPPQEVREQATADREAYIKTNAVSIVQELEARIERYKETITRLEKSRSDMRKHHHRKGDVGEGSSANDTGDVFPSHASSDASGAIQTPSDADLEAIGRAWVKENGDVRPYCFSGIYQWPEDLQQQGSGVSWHITKDMERNQFLDEASAWRALGRAVHKLGWKPQAATKPACEPLLALCERWEREVDLADSYGGPRVGGDKTDQLRKCAAELRAALAQTAR